MVRYFAMFYGVARFQGVYQVLIRGSTVSGIPVVFNMICMFMEKS